MKSIMLSIKPEWVAKILNGEKTIEIRKRFPKDYVGWVYIYCTKDRKKGWCMVGINGNETYYQEYDKNAVYSTVHNYIGNSKVVARFWCDKVKPAYAPVEELCQLACVTKDELYKYAGGWYNTDDLLAIHITKLEIFDKPKELGEFSRYHEKKDEYSACWTCKRFGTGCMSCRLAKAPQSWCYVEVLL